MSNPSSASQGGLDLEALKRTATEVRDNPRYGTMVMLPTQVIALIDRVRELEAEVETQYRIIDDRHVWYTARLASLQRVREAAVNYEEAAVRHRVVIYPEVTALRAALADSEEGRGLIQSRNPFSPKGRVVAPLDEEGG